MKKFTSIFAILLMTIQVAIAQVAGHDYARVISNKEDVVISDEEFYKIARTVNFPVNKYDIPENSSFYHELVDDIIPEMNSKNYRLVKIYLRGAASPEGTLKRNIYLANKRQQSLVDIINQNMAISSSENTLSVIEVPTDYDYLVKLMARAKDKDYQRVKSVVRKNSNDVIVLKNELLALDNGRLWTRLYHQYFPSLRNARVVLLFANPEKEKTSASDEIVKLVPDVVILAPPTISLEHKVPDEEPRQRVPRRELLSVKTNLLFDFAYMPAGYDRFCPIPNVALEYYPLHGHFTYGASFDCPWWRDYDAHKYFQVRNYQLESRYYFRSGDIRKNPPGEGAAFRGLYLQAYGHVGLYSIMFNANKGWEGEGFGGGLGIGYVMPLTKKGHWRLEFGAQVGYLWTKYDPYQYECPVDPTEHDNLYYYKWTLASDLFKKRQYRFNWIGPTRVGITLTYDLLYRRINKKGASFKNWEKVH